MIKIFLNQILISSSLVFPMQKDCGILIFKKKHLLLYFIEVKKIKLEVFKLYLRKHKYIQRMDTIQQSRIIE